MEVGPPGKRSVILSRTLKEHITIANSPIGPNYPVFVIAEAGVNHNGDLNLAKQLIDVAVEAGADAVKFQTFNAKLLATSTAPKAAYQIETTGTQNSQLDMLRQLELSKSSHLYLKKYCDEKGITFLSTPFDEASADFLEKLEVPAYKVSSGDLTNLPLIEHLSRKGKPVILSTGMATMEEVDEALRVVAEAGCEELAILQCVTNYPAKPDEVNLRAMNTMADAFKVPTGFSDHTEGIVCSLAAAALGAAIIEKHFTLDRNLHGPDHLASLEPDELRSLVSGIRTIQLALGNGRKQPTPGELETAKVARRSIVAATSIKAGTLLENESITLKRPGTGLPPTQLKSVLGKRARVDIPAGTLITLDMVE